MDLAASGSRHCILVCEYLGCLTLVGDPCVDHALFELNLRRNLLTGFRHRLHTAA